MAATRMDKVDDTELHALRPSDAFKVLIACFQAMQNVCLVGPPGCGKSSLFRQAAAFLGWSLEISNPSLEDPTEGGGIPWFEKGKAYAQKYPFETLYKVLTSKSPLIWLLEDFGGADIATQKAYMQWSEAREVDGKKLPPHVRIGMATNRRQDKAGVSGVLETIKGRFTLIHMKSDADDFCQNLFVRGKTEYGLSDEAIELGAAYISFRPMAVNEFKPTVDMSNTPTERNWVHAFKYIDSKLPRHMETACFAGRVGNGRAADFSVYIDCYRNMPDLAAIIANPARCWLPDKSEEHYLSKAHATAIGLARKATIANFAAIKTYAERYEQIGMGDFAVLMVRDCLHSDPQIEKTMAWKEMAVGPVGRLMQGR